MSVKADVERLRASLPPDFEFDEREMALIDLAAAQAADIDRLEVDITERGVRVGDRLNQSVAEARQARVALARILGQIDMPEVGTTAQLHARKAARGRWSQAS
jgi:hypothetical protein